MGCLETFLRGMETGDSFECFKLSEYLETFLRGMETVIPGGGLPPNLGALKPSLEGWKQEQRRIKEQIREALKPSLEGWKPGSISSTICAWRSLETFLRGMETSEGRRGDSFHLQP